MCHQCRVCGVMVFTLLLASVSVGFVTGGVHHHSGKERESDGAYSPRDHGHYKDGQHDAEFDHESILGSTEEADEYSQLPPEEAKRKLGLLVKKIDINSDGYVSREELKVWIINSFRKLSKDESEERFDEVDTDNNDCVTWKEHFAESYSDEDESSVEAKYVEEDRALFHSADANSDGCLTSDEYFSFSHPEEHPEMAPIVLKYTMESKDKNKDEKIDLKEYLSDTTGSESGEDQSSEEENFAEYDKNHDGFLDKDEVIAWMIPNNDEIAVEEVDHLFSESDDDKDNLLSYAEVVEHHETFVGSEVTEYGDRLHDEF